jgi:hypothetical protein
MIAKIAMKFFCVKPILKLFQQNLIIIEIILNFKNIL